MSVRDLILAFPKQIAAGAELGRPHALSKQYRRIIACGMGGSGVPGDLVAAIDTRILSWRDFSLPGNANTQDLAVCISWSGNTAETISAYQETRMRSIDAIVITKIDSELGRLAKAGKTTVIELPPDEYMPPRFAAGYATGALASLTGHADVINALSMSPEQFAKEGEDIAVQIGKKVPTIYVSRSVQALGPAWKMLFNENAKAHAEWNSFPELTHNELAEFSLQDASGYLPIIIKNPEEKSETIKLIDRTIAFLQKTGYTVSTVILSGSTILEKVLNGYLLGLWASCALAKRLGADPLDTQTIEAFKREEHNT